MARSRRRLARVKPVGAAPFPPAAGKPKPLDAGNGRVPSSDGQGLEGGEGGSGGGRAGGVGSASHGVTLERRTAAAAAKAAARAIEREEQRR
jgi:hypothetical protein